SKSIILRTRACLSSFRPPRRCRSLSGLRARRDSTILDHRDRIDLDDCTRQSEPRNLDHGCRRELGLAEKPAAHRIHPPPVIDVGHEYLQPADVRETGADALE